MASGLKRALDLLTYTVSAAVLGGGAVYAVHRLRAAPPPPPAVAAAVPAPVPAPPPAATVSPPPVETAPPAAAAPESPPASASAEAASAPAPAVPPPPSGGVLTTAKGDTYVLPAPSSSAEQDRSTYLALQRNCYDAAANNQTGQYPALQAAACNRYVQFAYEHGWNPGSLPPYGQAQVASAAPAYGAAQAGYPDDGSETVVYDAAIGGYRYIHRSHARTQAPHQIGPNYPLPPPQPQPPVSQEQHHSSVSRAAAPRYPQR
jgi:hypothetical protein